MGLITLADLEQHLQQGVPASLADSANASINDASAAVITECERDSSPWTAETVPGGVALIVKRVAARLFSNPQQRTSYSGPDGLNYSGGPTRLLTDDERAQCAPWRASAKRVGTIGISRPGWDKPAT